MNAGEVVLIVIAVIVIGTLVIGAFIGLLSMIGEGWDH